MSAPPVEEALAQRMAGRGKITFAEFMELALYWPNGGYYTSHATLPPAPDYFTAPWAHPAFGALLALQLEEMWRLLGSPARFHVMEQGAGSCLLATAIQQYAKHLAPAFARALRYIAVDRAATRIHAGPANDVEKIASTNLPFRGVAGCILSNELLDSLPAHRVVLRNGRLKEVYVAQENGAFVEVEGDPSSPFLEQRLRDEEVKLEEGHRTEVCFELEAWVKEASATLDRGFVLTIDYGHPAKELYSPQRAKGTLRCYYKHTLSGNPYVRVGRQDMTAHVDFTAVASLGAGRGLESQPLTTQAAFLNNLGLGTFIRRLASSGLGQRERDASRMGMLELARPGGMGEFKVLVQTKGMGQPRLTGVAGPAEEWLQRVGGLPLPLLGPDHLRLMEARYPHTASTSWQDSEDRPRPRTDRQGR